jgi:hypothetical protein
VLTSTERTNGALARSREIAHGHTDLNARPTELPIRRETMRGCAECLMDGRNVQWTPAQQPRLKPDPDEVKQDGVSGDWLGRTAHRLKCIGKQGVVRRTPRRGGAAGESRTFSDNSSEALAEPGACITQRARIGLPADVGLRRVAYRRRADPKPLGRSGLRIA